MVSTFRNLISSCVSQTDRRPSLCGHDAYAAEACLLEDVAECRSAYEQPPIASEWALAVLSP
jgi:hypothetical protein